MGDSNTPDPSSSSFPPLSSKSNLPMLYYGLVVVGTAAIVLAIYNLIINRWCSTTMTPRRDQPGLPKWLPAGVTKTRAGTCCQASSTRRKQRMVSEDTGGEYECAVCLSVFEDGDEVKQLLRCKHSFHAPCTNTWLFSHFDCPLCRASVDPDPSPICQ